jgi:hypothetical protein
MISLSFYRFFLFFSYISRALPVKSLCNLLSLSAKWPTKKLLHPSQSPFPDLLLALSPILCLGPLRRSRPRPLRRFSLLSRSRLAPPPTPSSNLLPPHPPPRLLSVPGTPVHALRSTRATRRMSSRSSAVQLSLTT